MPSSYRRFVVLSGPRTGSTLVQEALDSSPEIICFGEIFNQHLGFIDYRMEGYESTTADMDLRAANPGAFLRKRIFTEPATSVRAVGFKFHYDHFWGFPGLTQALQQDRDLLLVHLRRRNALRVIVSSKIAEKTGVYFESAGTRTGLLGAMARTLRRLRPRPSQASAKVIISPAELRQAVLESDLTAMHWEEIFKHHEILRLSYEDLMPDPTLEFDRLQSFLGVGPSKLKIRVMRQNPQPLPHLIENYTDLAAAFRGSDVEWMLQE